MLTITPWDLPLGIICGDLGAIIRPQPNRLSVVECNFAVRMFDSNQALFKRNQNHLEKHYSVQKLRNEPIIKLKFTLKLRSFLCKQENVNKKKKPQIIQELQEISAAELQKFAIQFVLHPCPP